MCGCADRKRRVLGSGELHHAYRTAFDQHPHDFGRSGQRRFAGRRRPRLRGRVPEPSWLRRTPIVVTAAHCLVDAFLANGTQGLPSCHPARYTEDGTYKALLGPLGAEPTVWATCLFVDPIAGIAVLGQPDNQVLIDEAAAFDALMDSVRALAIADAPAQGSELVTGFGGRRFERKSHAREGLAWVLSLRRALARGPRGTSWRVSVVLRQIARRLDGRSNSAPHRANAPKLALEQARHAYVAAVSSPTKAQQKEEVLGL